MLIFRKKLNTNQTLYLAILCSRAMRSSTCRRCCSAPGAPPLPRRRSAAARLCCCYVLSAPPLPGAALLASTALISHRGCLDAGYRTTDALAIGRQGRIRDQPPGTTSSRSAMMHVYGPIKPIHKKTKYHIMTR